MNLFSTSKIRLVLSGPYRGQWIRVPLRHRHIHLPSQRFKLCDLHSLPTNRIDD